MPASWISARSVGATAAVRASIERIAELDGRFNSFINVDADAAIERASLVDRLVGSGNDSMALAGIPVAVKDLCAVDGLGCGAGTRLDIRDLLPREGPFIGALKRAGAVVVGKTRTTEFALGGYNLTHPMPRNPLSVEAALTPGGSSSGSAVAVAAGLVPLAIGTDTGGSVRLPAALCGIVGYKSSRSMWSTDGIFPLSPTFDSIGLLTERVASVASVVEACSGVRVPRDITLREVRIGVPTPHFQDDLDPEVGSAFEKVLSLLSRCGVSLVEISLPEVAECDAFFARLVPWELVQFLGKRRIRENRELLDPVALARINGADGFESAAADRFRERRRDVVATVSRRLHGIDCWISPTTPYLPRPIDTLNDIAAIAKWNAATTRYTRPVNFFDQCAITVPLRMEKNLLPSALQIAAAGGNDGTLLAIAGAIEYALRDRKSNFTVGSGITPME